MTDHVSRRPPATAPPAIGPGVVLGGKYRLEATIAHGGGAKVWRAVHVTLNQPVAVKFLDGVHATRTESFLREAKVAASVRNNHVVDIIDFGILETAAHEPEPYMVMALLEGEALDTRIGRGAMPDALAVSIGLQVLSGLEAVHRASIVHRDVKPANIFLTDDDEGVLATLLDFGISQEADDANDAHLVIGTPEYMSPEQALGAPLDLRSDLYSLGVVLYEMLTGVLPFEHDDPRKLVALVAAAQAMPLGELRPDIPEIARIVERAMHHGAEGRWSSAREMRHALLDVVGRGPDATGRTSSLLPEPLAPPPERDTTPNVLHDAVTTKLTRLGIPTRARATPVVLALSLLAITAMALGWAATGAGEPTASASSRPSAPRPITAPESVVPPPPAPPAAPTPAPAPPIAPAPAPPIAPAPAPPIAPTLAEAPTPPAPAPHARPTRSRPRTPARAPALRRDLDF